MVMDSACNAIINITGDMAVHDVQQHQQPKPVRLINQSLIPHTRSFQSL